MASKEDLNRMATKDDIAGMATKEDIQRLETKMNEHDYKIDRNFQQIATNAEKLHEFSANSVRLEKIMETLSIRSIEQEGKIRNLTVPADYTPSK
jgi:hypothetical protein